jgi:ABC-type glycerol-3-phosphate transport system substrate-binding protein
VRHVRLPRLSILVILALALSCGRRTSTHPVEVTFWQTWPVEAIAPLVRNYEQENPSVHIVVSRLPANNATDTLALAAQSGRPPDLVELSPEQAASFIDEGLLSDWSAGVADLKPALRGCRGSSARVCWFTTVLSSGAPDSTPRARPRRGTS